MSTKASAIQGAVALTTVAAASWWLLLRNKKCEKPKVRRGIYACNCGKVQAELIVQPASYKYIEQPSLMCCCSDCVDSCEAMLAAKKATNSERYFSPGVHLMLFFDQEVHFRKGKEYLKAVKLTKKSANRRLYASCCGTPLAIAEHGLNHLFAANILSCEKLQAEEVPLTSTPPTVCLHYRENRMPGETPRGTKVIPWIVAPRAIGGIIARLIVTAPFYKGTGNGFPLTEDLSIGLESID